MSVIDRVLSTLRRVPRGFPADGRQLGIGLAAALDAQRRHGAEPLDPKAKAGDLGGARAAGYPPEGPGDRVADAAR
ncbi:MAG: hypothetical protein L0I76_31875 [Pseudonocardia sp.]|nr:hypothetical protein [Pseudonocardia sp.]